jgi:hypothetical protein
LAERRPNDDPDRFGRKDALPVLVREEDGGD